MVDSLLDILCLSDYEIIQIAHELVKKDGSKSLVFRKQTDGFRTLGSRDTFLSDLKKQQGYFLQGTGENGSTHVIKSYTLDDTNYIKIPKKYQPYFKDQSIINYKK